MTTVMIVQEHLQPFPACLSRLPMSLANTSEGHAIPQPLNSDPVPIEDPPDVILSFGGQEGEL